MHRLIGYKEIHYVTGPDINTYHTVKS